MLSAGRVTQQTASWVREQAAYFSGMYACAYGFPLVMMDVTRQVMTATPSSGEYSAPSTSPLSPRLRRPGLQERRAHQPELAVGDRVRDIRRYVLLEAVIG
jgi:hypothetical protein